MLRGPALLLCLALSYGNVYNIKVGCIRRFTRASLARYALSPTWNDDCSETPRRLAAVACSEVRRQDEGRWTHTGLQQLGYAGKDVDLVCYRVKQFTYLEPTLSRNAGMVDWRLKPK